MRTRERLAIVRRARKNPEVLKTDEYIDAQLSSDLITGLTVQMGPNCNLHCSHCYGDYGPHRRGLPKPVFIEKALEGAVELGLSQVSLTDGEPFRHENKKVVGLVARFSEKVPARIVTNCSFARTGANTARWFEFLKESGFNLSQKGNLIEVSFGLMYRVSFGNYMRFNEGVKFAFPQTDFGQHLRYRHISERRLEEELKLLHRFSKGLNAAFDIERIKAGEGQVADGAILNFPSSGKSPIYLEFIWCRPYGRAEAFTIFEDIFPHTRFTPENTIFTPDEFQDLWVGFDGRVSFAKSGQCVQEGRYYGNLKDSSLPEIKKRILADSVYQAFNLGGVRFLYSLAQEVNPRFVVEGRIRCHVCNAFFADRQLVDGVRELLEGGVISKYRDFVEKFKPKS